MRKWMIAHPPQWWLTVVLALVAMLGVLLVATGWWLVAIVVGYLLSVIGLMWWGTWAIDATRKDWLRRSQDADD